MLRGSMLEETLEELVRRATEADGGADLGRAREEFHARTGPFEPGEAWYEARIRFFLDWYLVSWVSPDGSRPAARVARDEPERALAAALARGSRGLFEVLDLAETGETSVVERVGGARFRIPPRATPTAEPLRRGDLFDGHLLVLADALVLAPGLLFHPAEAHEPIAALLARARAERTPRPVLLDGLLRMRMRLDRFTNMRARHIYRWESLADRQILSAGWARRGS
jgi:hypothetical protein